MSKLKLDQSKPKWQGKLFHFKTGFEFHLLKSRQSDLETLLKTWQMTEGEDYRLTLQHGYLHTALSSYLAAKAFISFRRKRQAALFKFSWDPCDSNTDWKVVLPIIRRVMPSVIAQEIIGVQPMTATGNPIHSLRSRQAPEGEPPALDS